MWKIIIAIALGLLIFGCSPINEEIINSENAQDGLWELAQKELCDTTPTAEVLTKWRDAIPAIRLENRRRAAAVAEKPFDMAANLAELGIKPSK